MSAIFFFVVTYIVLVFNCPNYRIKSVARINAKIFPTHGSVIWWNYPSDFDHTIANSPLTNISYAHVRFNTPAAATLITRVIITVRNYLLYINGALANWRRFLETSGPTERAIRMRIVESN